MRLNKLQVDAISDKIKQGVIIKKLKELSIRKNDLLFINLLNNLKNHNVYKELIKVSKLSLYSSVKFNDSIFTLLGLDYSFTNVYSFLTTSYNGTYDILLKEEFENIVKLNYDNIFNVIELKLFNKYILDNNLKLDIPILSVIKNDLIIEAINHKNINSLTTAIVNKY